MSRLQQRQSGFALLLVIWVVAILAVLAAGFAAATRTETRLARNLMEAARARALAEAGVARAIEVLLYANPADGWRPDGTPREIKFDGGGVIVRVEDENGKIDINVAPPELLSGLCAEVGIVPDLCNELVGEVIARRQLAPAVLRAPRPGSGQEVGSGRDLGVGAFPMQRRQAAGFSVVDELRELPAVDVASFERLKPFVTVYSQSPSIDPTVAPREVLLAIPGVNPREVELVLAGRAAPPGGPPLPDLTLVDRYVARGQLRAATIIAEAHAEGGGTFTRRAVVALTGARLHPTQMLEWRQDLSEEHASRP